MADFVDLCILGGCDYVRALPGIGLKKGAEVSRGEGENGNCEKWEL